ncbi:MAG: hypothetical protein V4514_11130 [Pseudomonadota bacterium]|uniref:hypothetical protein n=1 Tax=unclassified Phenylobacterium TaxID=2640670 RepID=UPI000701479A|nr:MULTISPECIES: hypothetical protein [unclassified Phenylobacterium]KRB49413.1 hypothetical protein ASE02_16435 [Phenylobacterium sp. Root700]MBT9473656.1 hypothetical protein [Phenylobacterium sp.]
MRTRAAALILSAAVLCACAPTAPKGVDKAALDDAVSRAIGDPGTCVLIAKGDKLVYRYGSNVVCGRTLPACDQSVPRTLADLLAAAPAVGQPRTASCRSNAQGTRVVAWAAGPIEGGDLVYAAVMEGDEVPPGVIIADKLKTAFTRAGMGAK